MLPYLFFFFKNANNYLYITFKHYNIKPKIQINKKEYYCMHKARVMGLVFFRRKNLDHFLIYACHPCTGAMLIFFVSFQFYRMSS